MKQTFKQFLTEAESVEQFAKFLKNLFLKRVFNRENYDSENPPVGIHYKNGQKSFEDWQNNLFNDFVDIREHDEDDPFVSVKFNGASWIHKDILEHLIGRKIEEPDNWHQNDFAFEKELDKLVKSTGWEFSGKNNRWYTFSKSGVGKTVSSIPKTLYHFSAYWNKDRILKKGLIPKSVKDRDNFRYSERIFLLKDYKLDSIKELAFYVHNYDNDHDIPEDIPIVVFAIDTSKLRPGTKFYEDSGHPGAIWTKTHIPAEAIKVKYEDEIPKDEIGY